MQKALDLKQLIEFAAAMARAPAAGLQAAKAGMGKALMFLHGELPDYPAPPGPDAPSPLKTERQRRWFFRALQLGLIQVPYRRTMTLEDELTTEVQERGSVVEGVIGTETPYAPYVIGVEQQAEIHQGRWWTLEEEVDEHLEGAVNVFEEAFFADFRRLTGL